MNREKRHNLAENDVDPDVQLRRMLREWVTADWRELCAAQPTAESRQQRQRERRRIARARQYSVVPWRPAHWLGRRLSQVERLALVAALNWFHTGNGCIARVGEGRLKEVRLADVVPHADYRGEPAP